MILQQVSQTFQPLVTINDSNSGQRSYIRLPIAGSLDSKGLQVGNPGFAVTLHSSINLILCGVSVFLPHPIENQQKYSEIQINFELCEHGIEHSGPIGAQLIKIKSTLLKKEVIEWAQFRGCPRSKENRKRSSLFCFQGYFWHHNFIQFL